MSFLFHICGFLFFNAAGYHLSKNSMNHRIAYNVAYLKSIMDNVYETRQGICSMLADHTTSDTVEKTSRLISQMKGIAAQEIREFAHFPLEAVDYVTLPAGKKVLRSNLMINYTKVFPLLAKDFKIDEIFTSLGGVPTSTIDDIVLKLHNMKVYSNRLHWTLEDRKELKTIPMYDIAKLRRTEHKINDQTWMVLNNLKYQIKDCEELIKSLNETHKIYCEHPVQLAIRDDVTEGSLTFAQWKQKYDDVYSKLAECSKEKLLETLNE